MTRVEALEAAEPMESGSRYACAHHEGYVLHARIESDGTHRMIQMKIQSVPSSEIREIEGFVLFRTDEDELVFIPPDQWPLVDSSLDWRPVTKSLL